MSDRVNHPSHYTWLKDKCGIEVIDITRHLDFDIGNAIKYLLRSGHKSEKGFSDVDKEIEDLQKAIWYIEDKIRMLQADKARIREVFDTVQNETPYFSQEPSIMTEA